MEKTLELHKTLHERQMIGQQTYEKVINIINYEGNAKQHHKACDVKISKVMKTESIKCWHVKQLEIQCISSGNIKWYITLKLVWQFLLKIKVYLPCDSFWQQNAKEMIVCQFLAQVSRSLACFYSPAQLGLLMMRNAMSRPVLPPTLQLLYNQSKRQSCLDNWQLTMECKNEPTKKR